MPMKNFFRISAPLAFCLSALLGNTAITHAQPAKAAMGKKKPGKMPVALKRAERVAGKPLTEAQKKTIRKAAAERRKAMDPINKQFDTTVAKALGMTVEQYKAKVKATSAR